MGQNLRTKSFKIFVSNSIFKETFSTAYHHASDGLVERTNRKILEILRPLAGKFHESGEDWFSHVAASINRST